MGVPAVLPTPGAKGGFLTKKEKDHSKYIKRREVILEKLRTPENREKARIRMRESTRALRLEFLKEYGGVCECCGENQYQFLSLEHKDGRGAGAAHRRELKTTSGTKIIKDLKVRGWPKDKYGILCYNCNLARGFAGYCHVL